LKGLSFFAAITMVGLQAVATAAGARECRVVQGRYAIYANHDRLWVVGSKHLLDVSIDKLDDELDTRGWEKTAAYGTFTICADHIGDPRALSVRDRVQVTDHGHLEFRPHR